MNRYPPVEMKKKKRKSKVQISHRLVARTAVRCIMINIPSIRIAYSNLPPIGINTSRSTPGVEDRSSSQYGFGAASPRPPLRQLLPGGVMPRDSTPRPEMTPKEALLFAGCVEAGGSSGKLVEAIYCTVVGTALPLLLGPILPHEVSKRLDLVGQKTTKEQHFPK